MKRLWYRMFGRRYYKCLGEGRYKPVGKIKHIMLALGIKKAVSLDKQYPSSWIR